MDVSTLDACTDFSSNRSEPKAVLRRCGRPRPDPARLLNRAIHVDLKPTRQELVQNSAYSRRLLHRDDRHEIASARWLAGRACPLHGHGDSAVLLRVLSGTLIEERYLPDGYGGYRYEAVTLRAGDESHLPAGTYHRISCLESSDTIHAFDPPPTNAVTPVPASLREVLAAAKRHVLDVATTKEIDTTQDPVVTVTSFADRWAARERNQTDDGQLRVHPETLAELRASGLLAAPVPVELGGWGASLTSMSEAVRILARTAPATALALAMPLGNAATTRIPDTAAPLAHRAALAEGRRWIAEQVLAGHILAVANSEPGAGGDLAQTRTIADRDADGGYQLTGRKAFATLGPDADYFLCAARTAEGVVDGFFVRRDAVGVTLGDDWNPLGMRATASVGLTLDGAEAAAVMGYPGCLEGANARHWSTTLFAAVFVGVGEGAIAAAVTGVGEAGAASHYVRAKLAEAALDLEAAAGLLQAVASDERCPLPADARDRTVRAKTFAAKSAVAATTQAAMLCGGRAYSADHLITRLLHDALAGPLLRPPLAKAMDDLAKQLFA